MTSEIIRAVIVVTFALVCYSIGVLTEQRRHLPPAEPLTRFAHSWWVITCVVGAVMSATMA